MYVPERILSNEDLIKLVDTTDEWIMTRTGIRQRRIAAPGEATSDIALKASLKALAEAKMAPEELTHVIVGTITPDYYCPGAACLLSNKLGLKGRMSMDVNAACSGFLYALQTARGFVALDPKAKVLVAPTDVLTSRTNWSDRSTCVLFGDGGGAVVVTAADGNNPVATVEDIILGSDGSMAELLSIKGGGSGRPMVLGEATQEDFFIQMNGREVYKFAVRAMASVSRELLEKHGLTMDDIDIFIPHQANLRIIEAVGKKLGASSEKVFVNVDRYGNTSAASLVLALSEAWDLNFIKPGQRVLLTTFGAGFTWGAALMQF
jgi:3-oxoacyl-[acyl-carrier-protein] synthase-3